ncbi:MAG: iron-containing alcohol dehydrogenase family protein [Oscillospiraceae bacterium]|jgi:glycerol dehydrogenase|nr:iron-containing alcohol dehydrogenase family protein [Oscillospiraceae bacterium]
MTSIVSPKWYLSKPGAVREAGAHIAGIAKRVYVAGGETALRVARDALELSLSESGIEFETLTYSGYPTHEAARDIASRAEKFGAEAVVGVGGGRALDTVKAAGHYAHLPVITVPTVAATCASWAPCSIMYNDEGEFVEPLQYDDAPVLIIADTDIIARAPIRYIRSGAADALARWYEQQSNLRASNGFYLRWTLKQAELIREILEGKGLEYIDELAAGKYVPAHAREVIDANILLTGFFVSPRNTDEPFAGGFAHPLYHTFTILHDLHSSLHGEQIAFFLVVAGILEGQPDVELETRLSIFSALRQPLTLSELHLTKDVDEKLLRGARALLDTVSAYGRRVDTTPEQIRSAILKADALGRGRGGLPSVKAV